jgi:glucose/arabinose dehydrogenase
MTRNPDPPRPSRSRLAILLLPAAVSFLALSVSRPPAAEPAAAPPSAEPPGSAPLAAAAADIALQTLASGRPSLTSIASAGDARLFLTQQTGQIVVWNGTAILPAPFLDLSGAVSCCGERGLLSVAFHPRYASTGFFFVNYTNTPAGDTVIARYRVSSGNPNAADPASGVILKTITQPFANHNGGELQFGPDGYLYVGMGDGGSANDPMCNAQRDDTLLGKLLRIDVDQNVATPPFYGIPPTNPLFSGATPNEIWDKGLRNPWRFSFDRATGDLYIGDVGQSAVEEIDFEPHGGAGGRNYGWKIMEGSLCGGGGSSACPAGVPPCMSPLFTPPIYEYGHGSGDCSVTGGYVYRGSAMPSFRGVYFYGDYCTGRIWGNGQLLTARAPGLTTFGEDAAGELYAATESGVLYRIVETGVVPTATPTSTVTPTARPTVTVTPSATAVPPTATPSPAEPTPRPLRRRPTPRVIVRPPL